MDNKEYADLVNNNCFPNEIKIPIDQIYEDKRGKITNVWLGNSGSITYIESKAGSIRAKHKHQLDWHATFMIEGQVKYIEEENGNRKEWIFNQGEQFFTKP